MIFYTSVASILNDMINEKLATNYSYAQPIFANTLFINQ